MPKKSRATKQATTTPYIIFRISNRFPEQLMQTKLPIITHEERGRLRNWHVAAGNHKICTFDISRRRTACEGDEVGPLVYDDRLLGILLHTGRLPWTGPDVFLDFNNFIIHDLVDFHIHEVRGV